MSDEPDIVERLRRPLETAHDREVLWHGPVGVDDLLVLDVREAADEIERLRAKLDAIRDHVRLWDEGAYDETQPDKGAAQVAFDVLAAIGEIIDGEDDDE